MASFRGLVIGLSCLVCVILIGIVAEIYYLFYVRRKRTKRGVTNLETKIASGVSFLFCCKIRRTEGDQKVNPNTIHPNKDLEMGNEKEDSLLKGIEDESVEEELMRLHNLCGPPRFLFTINEETNEDLESQDGRSRSKSLSDLFTPMSSPPTKSLLHLDSYNPLFESSTDAEIHRLRSSPPPKLKFLRDAEEKLIRRLMMEKGCSFEDFSFNPPAMTGAGDEQKVGSFVSFLAKSKESEPIPQQILPLYHSAPSKVLPLASSP
ncbi:unnamed protein product [Cuscuta epithymum]|uniref:Uncharacterized protein n=1 Tax=Cuscuta epithymum TaxID=186058 RepID=A0AAV0DY77_9ASTE|nr:unnamed protein product [Cuscuta epithymum]CAH9109137.1 unnamed protein product [Cuscuta epithymum]CAH9143551.1 unnamed protein product [Cuscuta epithymum]